MRHSTIVTAAVVIVAMAFAPLGAAAAPNGYATTDSAPATAAQTNESTDNETDVDPGERLGGVVGVQEAEISGDLAERSFGIRIAKAASNDSKVAVVNETVGDLQQRLAEIREEKQRLRAARDNGSMSQGQYAARMAALSAESESVRSLATETETQSSQLPADVLAANGVNVSAIQTLKHDATNMTGPEVAAVARTIAGQNVGGPPERAGGPPENATDGSGEETGDAGDVERAAAAVERATDAIDRANDRVNGDSGEAADALATARATLTDAEETLAEARDALAAGDESRASELATEAVDLAGDAESNAETARNAVDGGQSGPDVPGDNSTDVATSDDSTTTIQTTATSE